MAVNNSKIYKVEDYIDFIIGDFFQLAPFLKVFIYLFIFILMFIVFCNKKLFNTSHHVRGSA